jgi:hypothetical protein
MLSNLSLKNKLFRIRIQRLIPDSNIQKKNSCPTVSGSNTLLDSLNDCQVFDVCHVFNVHNVVGEYRGFLSGPFKFCCGSYLCWTSSGSSLALLHESTENRHFYREVCPNVRLRESLHFFLFKYLEIRNKLRFLANLEIFCKLFKKGKCF